MIDEQATEVFHTLMPLSKELGVEVLRNTAEQVVSRLAWAPRLCTAGGVLHGGTIMALADGNGAACALANLPDDAAGTTTIESKTNFLRAVSTGYATAISRPLHVGRRIIVVETDVLDDSERRVARVTQSQAVL
ncbi:MAG: PaaI family thioesterase [Sciscionella sp.]